MGRTLGTISYFMHLEATSNKPEKLLKQVTFNVLTLLWLTIYGLVKLGPQTLLLGDTKMFNMKFK